MFKTRYNNHICSFNNSGKRSSTELSSYVWSLKDNNIQYVIEWTILKHAKSYNKSSKVCNLCNLEKYYILFRPELATLNKRNDLITTCRHASKHLIAKS